MSSFTDFRKEKSGKGGLAMILKMLSDLLAPRILQPQRFVITALN
jgi:hypothetical protein